MTRSTPITASRVPTPVAEGPRVFAQGTFKEMFYVLHYT